jgi:hypothetical protein
MIDSKSIWGHFLAGKPFVKRDGAQLTLQFSPASIQSQLYIDEPHRLHWGYTRTLLGFSSVRTRTAQYHDDRTRRRFVAKILLQHFAGCQYRGGGNQCGCHRIA